MLSSSTYRDAFRKNYLALAEAAKEGITRSVPSCPGWSIATLLTHLTLIYAGWSGTARPRTGYSDLDLPPEYQEWFDAEDHSDLTRMPPDLLDLFLKTSASLEDTLWRHDAAEPMWTWWPQDQTVGFWQRRMTHETAIHRWDAQLPFGRTDPIDSDLAADGIDEVFDVMIPAGRTREDTENLPEAHGESFHFHRTDGPGEWVVRFEGKDAIVSHEHAKADVALQGVASDLLLFLWGRIPADNLKVYGDRALLDRYFELVPSF